MADTTLALAWRGERHSRADRSRVCRWDAAALIRLPRVGGGRLSHAHAEGGSQPSRGLELGRSGLGVVWALLSQDGAHARDDRPALLRRPVCLYGSIATRYLIGQKPFLVLFLMLFGRSQFFRMRK